MSNHWSNAILLPDTGSNRATQVLYLFIILFAELSILLHDLMQPCLHSVLTAAEGITVTVQETVHIGAFHHLHQDGGQLSLQGQQTLKQHSTTFQLCAIQATNTSGSFMVSLQSAPVPSQLPQRAFVQQQHLCSPVTPQHFQSRGRRPSLPATAPGLSRQSLSSFLENADTAEALKSN